MISISKIVKEILDSEYSKLCNCGKDKPFIDAAIKADLELLSDNFRSLLHNDSQCPDYGPQLRRFAYYFRYTISHAEYVYRIINNHSELAELFDNREVEISCIGGGPGSELFGILKYLIVENKAPALICNILDREYAWIESWYEVVTQKRFTGRDLRIRYAELNTQHANTCKDFARYLQPDLFTLSYFMSEAWKHKTETEAFLSNVLNEARRGSLILIIDFNHSSLTSWANRLIAKHQFAKIRAWKGRLGWSNGEQKSHLAGYLDKFGSPKIESDIFYMLHRKE